MCTLLLAGNYQIDGHLRNVYIYGYGQPYTQARPGTRVVSIISASVDLHSAQACHKKRKFCAREDFVQEGRTAFTPAVISHSSILRRKRREWFGLASICCRRERILCKKKGQPLLQLGSHTAQTPAARDVSVLGSRAFFAEQRGFCARGEDSLYSSCDFTQLKPPPQETLVVRAREHFCRGERILCKRGGQPLLQL